MRSTFVGAAILAFALCPTAARADQGHDKPAPAAPAAKTAPAVPAEKPAAAHAEKEKPAAAHPEKPADAKEKPASAHAPEAAAKPAAPAAAPPSLLGDSKLELALERIDKQIHHMRTTSKAAAPPAKPDVAARRVARPEAATRAAKAAPLAGGRIELRWRFGLAWPAEMDVQPPASQEERITLAWQ